MHVKQKYIERYYIKGLGEYGITEDNGRITVLYGAIMVSVSDSIQDARRSIHTHASARLNEIIDATRGRLNTATSCLESLTDRSDHIESFKRV